MPYDQIMSCLQQLLHVLRLLKRDRPFPQDSKATAKLAQIVMLLQSHLEPVDYSERNRGRAATLSPPPVAPNDSPAPSGSPASSTASEDDEIMDEIWSHYGEGYAFDEPGQEGSKLSADLHWQNGSSRNVPV